MFLSLKKILPKKIGSFNLNQYFIDRELKRAWQVVLETQTNFNIKILKPLYFKNGVYFIGCLDACQANELRFQERGFCQTLNQILKRPLVNKIKFLSY